MREEEEGAGRQEKNEGEETLVEEGAEGGMGPGVQQV